MIKSITGVVRDFSILITSRRVNIVCRNKMWSFVHYVNEDNLKKKYLEKVPFDLWLRCLMERYSRRKGSAVS